jgi:Lrp/AsnC family leucine-responsive transcriptional regulator
MYFWYITYDIKGKRIMAFEFEKILDSTGWQILQELQQNGRISYSELGQRIGLSAPAIADRIRRMEEAGIISGYRAEVDMSKLGLAVMAIIRLSSMPGQSCSRVALHVSEIPEVLECYRVTGNDSVVVKVVATSIAHLERVIEQLTLYGLPTTSIVLSKPMQRYTITPAMFAQEEQ